MNQTPIERLAALQLLGTRTVAEAALVTLPVSERAIVQAGISELLTANGDAIVQCYADHLRCALTDEQAAEVLAYIERPKPEGWARFQSAVRLGGAAVNVIMGVK